MKFLKKLFSKTTLVLLILLIELSAIILAILYLESYLRQIVYFAIYGLALLLTLFIINKKENPEHKIPWLVLILAVPFIGVPIYLLFSKHFTTKKETKILNNALNSIEDFYKIYPDNLSFLEDYIGVGNYLKKDVPLKGHLFNKVTYFKSGEEYFTSMKEDLKKAKQFIFLEYFIIGKGKLWDEIYAILKAKAKEGVEVIVIYDDIGSSSYLPSSYYRKLRKNGIKCYKFNSFKPILSGIFNNRDHRKITVIDHLAAYTGGLNISDEYVNITHPFGYWKDVGIKVEGTAVSNFIAIFLSNYDMTRKEVSDYNKYLNDSYTHYNEPGFVLPISDGPRPFYDDYISENLIINMANTAKKKFYISTPYLIPSYTLLIALANAGKRGIDVRIIIPGIPDKKVIYMMSKSNVKMLLDAGVKVYTYTPGFNHAKSYLVDDVLAYVGTVNLDYRSLVHHYENAVLIYKNNCVNDIANDFKQMLDDSHELDQKTFKMNIFSRLLCSLLKLFAPLL